MLLLKLLKCCFWSWDRKKVCLRLIIGLYSWAYLNNHVEKKTELYLAKGFTQMCMNTHTDTEIHNSNRDFTKATEGQHTWSLYISSQKQSKLNRAPFFFLVGLSAVLTLTMFLNCQPFNIHLQNQVSESTTNGLKPVTRSLLSYKEQLWTS